MSVVAIDPGPTESAWVHIDDAYRPFNFGKAPNDDVREMLTYDTSLRPQPTFAIEMIASYGMAVGADVFETCVWIGRFAETIDYRDGGTNLIPRSKVKVHLCHSNRAKDPNIVQALIDRFAPGVPNKGKGSKAAPGWFYGFAGDVWQAMALAVYVADTAQRRDGAA